MKLYIVIINYKKYLETKNCLNSLFRFLPEKYTENIIFVDNESMGDIEGVRKRFPEVAIIKNKENLGFAKAINQGIGEALKRKATHILILNNDTIVNFDFVTPLLNSNYDLVSPIIKFKRKGKGWYDFGGRVNWLFGRPYHLETKKITNYKLQITNYKLDYVSGCAILTKRKVFEKIGLFDEKYFLYFEDVDFCLRAKKAGFTMGVEKNSLVTHLLEEEKSETRLFKLKYLLLSQKIFIDKWVSWYFKPFACLYYLWLKIKIHLGEVKIVVLPPPRCHRDD